MHPIDTHSFKESSEPQVSNYVDHVAEQALQTASFFDTVADLPVKSGETPLRARHLVLDPCCEVERVVEDLLVGGTALNLLKKFAQVLFCLQLVAVEAADLAQCVHLLSFLDEVLFADGLYEAQCHQVSIVWNDAMTALHFKVLEKVPVLEERSLRFFHSG